MRGECTPKARWHVIDLRQQIILDESDAFMRIYGATRATKSTQDKPKPIYMTRGALSSHLTEDRAKRAQPTVGRPPWSVNHVVAAHGPHRLSVTRGISLLVLHGGLAYFPSEMRVIPSYKYKGRGSKWRHHNILFWVLNWVRVVLGGLGVEVLRRGAGNDALLQIVSLREWGR
jgi:hypothetical protein